MTYYWANRANQYNSVFGNHHLNTLENASSNRNTADTPPAPRRDDKYLYHFHIDESQTERILLPQSDLTDITQRKNVIFLPPSSACYTAAKSPMPTLFWNANKDKAEAAAGKAKKEPVKLSTTAEERTCGAERYHFTPYSKPLVSRLMRAAHEHIGLFQSFCHYHQRSIEKICKAIRGLKQDVKELSQKTGCQSDAGCSEPFFEAKNP